MTDIAKGSAHSVITALRLLNTRDILSAASTVAAVMAEEVAVVIPSIACLPPEILALIASLVEQAHDTEADAFDQGTGSLRSFIEVCKEWCIVGRCAAKRLMINCDGASDDISHVKQVLRLYPKADSLCFRSTDPGHFLSLRRIANTLPALSAVKHLKFVCKGKTKNSLRLPHTVDKWKDLESFSLSGYLYSESVSLPQSCESWKRLRRLDLGSLRLAASEAIFTIFGKWDNLQYLNLGTYNGSTLPSEVGKWTALKQLCMLATPNLNALPEEVGNWKKLQSLRLKNS